MNTQLLHEAALSLLHKRGGLACWQLVKALCLDNWGAMQLEQELSDLVSKGVLRAVQAGPTPIYFIVR